MIEIQSKHVVMICAMICLVIVIGKGIEYETAKLDVYYYCEEPMDD